MMNSNAYIGKGNRDGLPVMKVGKANDVIRREKQLGIKLEYSLAVLSEQSAYKVESKLRQLVINNGGIRFQNTIDWFHFDKRVYDLLTEYMLNESPDQTPVNPSLPQFDNEDDEIRYYQDIYQTLIIKQLRNENEDLRNKLMRSAETVGDNERKLLSQVNDRERDLLKQIAVLEYRLEQVLGNNDNDG